MPDKTNINLKYIEATRMYNSGYFSMAKDLFHELILSDPFRWEFWFSIAAIHQLEKKYSEAVLSYKRAAILNPNDARIYFHLAECLLSIDDKKNALSNLEIAEKHCIDSILKDKISILYKQNKSNLYG